MILLYFILFPCFLLISNAQNGVQTYFPDDFMFGVATSAYQSEGAWNDDGKGLSMWDYMVHTKPDAVIDKSNGDIACKSYYLIKRDIEMLKQLGVKTYRFSISWPRILPYGRADYVNQNGIAHYNALINELINNDIVPFVTMYHWDLPQNFNEFGGWLNEDIVDWFGDYARILYQNFGDRVKHWLTINEPHIHCRFGYGLGVHAPGVRSPGIGFYDCGRHILLANARAYDIYDNEFRATQKGQIGLVLDCNWPEPVTRSPDDADAVSSYLAFVLGQYADPVFSDQGNYPQLFIDQVAAASAEQGYDYSRLRPLTEKEIHYIKGSADFFALNTYNTQMVYRNKSLEGMSDTISVNRDGYYGLYDSPFVALNGSHDLWEYAPGLYNILTYIKNHYNNPPVYITENGFVSMSSGLADNERVAYIRNSLTALYAARLNGADVRGYILWTLMDDFEWSSGYTLKMGIYEVNMTDPSRTRTPRKSAFAYKDIIRSRVIDFSYDPDPDDDINSSHVCKCCPNIFWTRGPLIRQMLLSASRK